MKKNFLLILSFLARTGLLWSQVQAVPVFISGTEGYRVFRIPAAAAVIFICRCKDGIRLPQHHHVHIRDWEFVNPKFNTKSLR